MTNDFLDMLSALSAEEVEYLVVGAYALAAHGYPRATGDLDLWVRRSTSNSERLWRALLRFKAPMSDVTLNDFLEPDLVYQIGVAPRRIDILTSIDGVDFEEAWPRRGTQEVSGLFLPILSREDLTRNKRATGRPKDLADLAWLEADDPA
ncbi:MAG: hypothetical protein AAGA92_01695 [Planctomycetota bacterium]